MREGPRRPRGRRPRDGRAGLEDAVEEAVGPRRQAVVEGVEQALDVAAGPAAREQLRWEVRVFEEEALVLVDQPEAQDERPSI